MAVLAVKTFVAGEVLTASDLNAMNTNILSNGEDLAWPATKAKDFDGQELILDADGDTSITADTDDQIDFAIGGTDVFVMTSSGLAFNGDHYATLDTVKSLLRSVGIAMIPARLSTVEAKVASKQDALFINEASSF